MRTAEQIAEQIRKKVAETVKNEVATLSEEEFEKFVFLGPCPSLFGFDDNCSGVNLESCKKCWKKAIGRK